MEEHALTIGETTLSVDPSGAWITKLSDKNGDILFPRGSFKAESGESKLRGGCHVCVPQFGPVPRPGGLAQHGFGRDSKWAVQEITADTLVLSLAPTHEDYTDLQIVLTYRLAKSQLHVELSLHNDSSRTVRVAPGFHPYFATAGAATIGIDDETINVDAYHDMETIVGAKKVLEVNKRNITIASEELNVWALWSDRLGDYFCVEPTLGGNRFLNEDPQEDELLPPNAHASYAMMISW